MSEKKNWLIDVPVLCIFFVRDDCFAKSFEAVRNARPSKLLLWQDGPRNEKDMEGIMKCREIAENIDWDCEVYRCYNEKNYGCDPSEYISQKWAFSISDKCIVLEDDDIPSISFFHFCKEMLDRYEHDTRITMISGFNVEEETKDIAEDYFFSSNLSIWGWASWRRVVDQWDEHYTWLDDEQTVRQLDNIVKERGYRDDFLPMCRKHRSQNKAFYETILWSHMLMTNGLSIVPKKNLINNLGATADSTHFGGTLETLPRGYRRIFTMKRYEMDALLPETKDTSMIKHPAHVMEHVPYRQRVYRIMGWMNPGIKVARSFEELFLNLRYGNFSYIGQAIRNRV